MKFALRQRSDAVLGVCYNQQDALLPPPPGGAVDAVNIWAKSFGYRRIFLGITAMTYGRRIQKLFIFLAIGLVTLVGEAKEAGKASRKPEEDEARLTPERIFERRDFGAEDYAATWLDDTDAFWRLESAAEGAGRDLVRIDGRTGERQVVVTAAELTPPGEQSPLVVDSFQWSAKGDQAADLHQFQASLAAQDTRRLLGLRSNQPRAAAAWWRCPAGVVDVRQVLARWKLRRLCA